MAFASPKPKQISVPYNGKIADITETNTGKHTLTLANAGGTGAIAGETRKIVAIQTYANRMTGSGVFLVYSNEGSSFIANIWSYSIAIVFIADGTQRLQYSLDTANDDFDLYCMGYVVEV